MAPLYKELQAIDSYTIRLAHPFSDYDRQLLTLFYQPLIGRDAMSLFMTLWADAEQQDSTVYNHYHLMNILTLPLGPVFEARISLEAIGLMRTSRKKNGDAREFMYELLPPLDAKAFFADPLLSTFLFSKIGEQAYRNLRARFMLDVKREDDFEDVSRTFLDVYTPVQQGFSTDMNEDVHYKGRNEPMGVPFVQSEFDFDLLRSGLSEQMVPQAALSTVSKAMIAKMAFLYTLNPLDMQKVVMMALDEDLKLPEERLRKAAAEFYKMNVTKEPPVLQKVFVQEPAKPQAELKTRDDEQAHYLENTAPIDMLRDLSGKEPLSVDVQLAERLINTHGLSIGVVNTLLQFVYLRNDGKLTNKYVERIASHWMNKKVETAEAAMEMARQEHDKYTKWKNEGQKPSPQRKPTREEKVPEWFHKKEQAKDDKVTKKSAAVDEERRQLLKELGVTGDGVE
ncbi:replication initiation and membrane attachment family protein [Sporosarcina sp. YIM B06819]|uniref:replication initiation and membrane attachment family protein n=1 Tax=Sporosarcina sp. YIM B06819 TaxID=3081769 RepID=UPI00298BD509|nr:DnaD domain protein [Sporosarcina sp. YIM B06819]